MSIPKVRLTLSPSKVNGALPSTDSTHETGGPDAKKQKISIKVNGAKVAAALGKAKAEDSRDSEDMGAEAEKEEEEEVGGEGAKGVEKQKEVVDALSRDVREALSVVIQQ